jgi:hypothetical protein
MILAGKTVRKLITHFRGRWRILSASGEKSDEREEEKGFHLKMLISDTCFARASRAAASVAASPR